MNNMFQTTELVMESNDFSSDLNIAISLTNHKLDEKLFPRFVVITSLLLKSFKSFQVTKNKRMLDLFIQLLEGCQNQPFDEKSRSLFQRFKEQLKNLREEQINYRYITEKLQSELFTFTLTLVANIIYHNHEAQQNFLYGPTLISCFKEFNLDIYFNPSEVQPNYTPITNKSSQQKDQPNLNKSAHGFNKSDGNIYIKNFGDHVSSLKHTNQSNNQEISFADKVTQKSKKLERLEQKYERDEYFLNQTIKNKKRELEKVYRVQSQQQLMNYFKLSDAKQENIPHLMSNALDNNSDTSIRQKIREFLGTNFKTDFFDNLDDFVGCVKVLYGNSKIISAKIDRIFKGKQAEDFEDIEKLQMKFVEELRSRPIKLREQERIQRMKQQGTFDTNKSPSLNNFIDKNFSKNQPKGTLPSLANFDPLLLPQNQKYNNQNTIKLEAPQLSYLQNYRFELGDQDTFSKNFQRKNQIGALYRNAQSQFVQVQIDMNQKEEKLQDQCEDFKKVNQQLLEFRQAFRENLQTLNIIKKVKVGKQDQQNGEQKQVKFQEDLTGSGDSLIELKNLIIKQDNSYLLKQLFRQTIWTIILKLKRLKLDYDEIFINNVFPNSPFEREGSRDFFKAVKTNDLEKVQKMLKICKYHVYDFDSTRQTPLHWAARRNFFDVMALICEHGADLEAQDMGGRTPLFHCVIGGDMNSCRMLLARGANPYVKSLAKHKPSHFTENEVIKALLRKAEQLHTMMSLLPLKKRKDFWIRNVSVFSHHSSNQLNDKILNLKQTDLQIE